MNTIKLEDFLESKQIDSQFYIEMLKQFDNIDYMKPNNYEYMVCHQLFEWGYLERILTAIWKNGIYKGTIHRFCKSGKLN